MSRIKTPQTIQDSPEKSQETLKGVQDLLGSVPNMFRLIGNSPSSLEGYVSFNGALAKGKLDIKTKERIALAVAEFNQCGYCLAAHTYLGTNLAKLSMNDILSARGGKSPDFKADKAVSFAVKVTRNRGKVNEEDLSTLREVGYFDDEIVEIVAHVALNTLTNYMNEVFKTEIDFPEVKALA